MEEYKKIAARHLLNMFGEDWIHENKKDICTVFYDGELSVRIVFCLVSMLPSEEYIIDNKDSNYQPEGSISFDINKKDKSCKVFRNLFP